MTADSDIVVDQLIGALAPARTSPTGPYPAMNSQLSISSRVTARGQATSRREPPAGRPLKATPDPPGSPDQSPARTAPR